MNAIEKRARELLAAEYGDDPMMQKKVMAGTCRNEELVRAERALIAALTPPEGYVLVPTVLPEKMLDALYRAEGDMTEKDMHVLWSDILAARPEVNPCTAS